MEDFDPVQFMFEHPILNKQVFEQVPLTKSNLFSLASQIGCSSLSSGVNKKYLIQIIVSRHEQIKTDDLKCSNDIHIETSTEVELKLQIQLEQEKSRNEKERSHRLSLELELARVRNNVTQHSTTNNSNSFLDRQFKYVPEFSEHNIDEFFIKFEHIANLHEWNRSDWAMLIQSKLRGKAAHITSTMNITDSKDYDIVKLTVLRAYALVPEAYRQKFRNSKKAYKQTWSDFAINKELLFDKWLLSKEVESLESCKQVMVMEEIMSNMSDNLKKYITERAPNNTNELAKFADEYAFIHDNNTNQINGNNSHDYKNTNHFNKKHVVDRWSQPNHNYNSTTQPISSNFNHNNYSRSDRNNTRGNHEVSNRDSANHNSNSMLYCASCRRTGHTTKFCRYKFNDSNSK